jgi:site-specific recombinase XerD
MKCSDYEKALIEHSAKGMQDNIIEFVIYLRTERKVSPAKIRVHVAAIKHFFEINDFLGINWKKLSMFMGEFYSIVDDRPYTRGEIAKLLSSAHSIRDRAMIFMLSSAGLSIGGLLNLQLKHLIPIPKYDIYQIIVYKKAREKYTTFCINNFLYTGS